MKDNISLNQHFVPNNYLIDTHSHCYLPSMLEDRDEWIQRLKDNHVGKVLLPNIDLESVAPLHELCNAYPNTFYPMMGLHPCDVKENYIEVLDKIHSIINQNPKKYCGIGEIGLDYHWDLTFQKEQKHALEIQFEWAIAYNKAVSIHSRKSNHDVIPMIAQFSRRGLRGVMHCFSGSIQEAEKITDCGFYLGIGGVLTYPKSGLQEVVKNIDLKHIVLETDSPYLAPVPYRGKRNESAYVRDIAICLALLKEVSMEQLAKRTSENAIQLYQLITN